jgi:hypothetical protein
MAIAGFMSPGLLGDLEFGAIDGTISATCAMSNSMDWAIDTGFALLGLALIYWAAPLSIRYNAWTTGLRERHPSFNPPPTPEWRARNTKIMTVIFRVAGVFFLLRSVLILLGRMKPH